jgi:hypothetical protein
MNKVLKSLLIFARRVLIGGVIFTVISFLIYRFFHVNLADAFTYAGFISILIGAVSIPGKMNMDTSPTLFQSKSVSTRSFGDQMAEDFKERDHNYKFLLYMLTIGILMFLISTVISRLS